MWVFGVIFLETISNERGYQSPCFYNDDLATTNLELSDTVRDMRIEAFLISYGLQGIDPGILAVCVCV